MKAQTRCPNLDLSNNEIVNKGEEQREVQDLAEPLCWKLRGYRTANVNVRTFPSASGGCWKIRDFPVLTLPHANSTITQSNVTMHMKTLILLPSCKEKANLSLYLL